MQLAIDLIPTENVVGDCKVVDDPWLIINLSEEPHMARLKLLESLLFLFQVWSRSSESSRGSVGVKKKVTLQVQKASSRCLIGSQCPICNLPCSIWISIFPAASALLGKPPKADSLL